ncbi:MAG: hypothetical protein ACO1SV_16355 [Fimbriimonas sp.]
MLNSIRPQLALLLVAGLLVCVPAVLRSSPQKSPAPPVKKTLPPNPLEARIAALEASSKKTAEALESMAALSEKQGKAIEEAELRLTRMEAQLGDFAIAAKVDKALGTLRSDLDALREQGEEIDRLKRSTSSLVDDVQKVNGFAEDLARKVSSQNHSDLERKIESARDLAKKCEDKIRDLERRDDKHDDRLSRLESKG